MSSKFEEIALQTLPECGFCAEHERSDCHACGGAGIDMRELSIEDAGSLVEAGYKLRRSEERTVAHALTETVETLEALAEIITNEPVEVYAQINDVCAKAKAAIQKGGR